MHVYNPLVVLICYTAFTAIYWAAGGVTETGFSYIYAPLNWENLKFTAPFLLIGFFVALPLLHTFIWSLHLLRDFIFLRGEKKEVLPRIVTLDRDDILGYTL